MLDQQKGASPEHGDQNQYGFCLADAGYAADRLHVSSWFLLIAMRAVKGGTT
ncbi:hypothetical protein [Pseudomonas amygdali]|jgi:hypothetical protein|uniref:hypothetical protein n=1 Tax=Pseudomonas amygdali TaxID=47877 RepID=UPI000A8D66BF|nr:hypothetical protein [Pseudomonas amygdali]